MHFFQVNVTFHLVWKMAVYRTPCSEPHLHTTSIVRPETQDCISVVLEETEGPGAHAIETTDNGFKWTLVLTHTLQGLALKDVIILTNG